MLTIFGLLLSTGSRLMPATLAQDILDNQEGLAIQSGCNSYVVGHSYKPLGEEIKSVKKGDIIRIGECSYRVDRVTVVPRRETNMEELIKPNTLFMQTCMYGGTDYVLLVRGKRVRTLPTK